MSKRGITIVEAETAPGEAFVALYRSEHDGQVQRAYLLLGDAVTAHDVVADAFLSVYRRWGRIDDPGPYLNRCVLNGCRDVGRRNRRIHPVANPGDDPGEEGRVDPMDELLGEALAKLPFRQRAAIVLRFHGRCTESEIARHLDCRPGTVGSLIHRGLRTLRHHLGEEHP